MNDKKHLCKYKSIQYQSLLWTRIEQFHGNDLLRLHYNFVLIYFNLKWCEILNVKTHVFCPRADVWYGPRVVGKFPSACVLLHLCCTNAHYAYVYVHMYIVKQTRHCTSCIKYANTSNYIHWAHNSLSIVYSL